MFLFLGPGLLGSRKFCAQQQETTHMWAAQCMHAQEEVQCSQGAIYVVIARRHDRVWTRGGTAALIVRYSIIK